jgi:hypothetical protein
MFTAGAFMCGFCTFLTSIGANYQIFMLVAMSNISFNVMFYLTLGPLTWIIMLEHTDIR